MTERTALLIAAVTSMTWGLTGIFVRLLPALSPLTVTAGRMVIALLVALPAVALLRGSRHGFAVTLTRPVAYLLAALLTGYYLLATAAFQWVPVAEAALLLSTPPLFVLALRHMRGDRAARSEIAGALLALAGIGWILAPRLVGAGGRSPEHIYGDLAALGAAALTAVYAYLYRRLAERNRAPATLGVSLLTFALGGATLTLAAMSMTPTAADVVDGHAVLLFVGLGVVSTAIPSLGFALASRRLPAIVTATISLFIPIFAGLFALLILGEALSPTFLGGCVLVLTGVAMIIRRNRRRNTAPERDQR